MTEITVSQPLTKETLSGSVVRIGQQWSVVKSSGPTSLIVWGKIGNEAPSLEILDHYAAKALGGANRQADGQTH